MTVAQSNNMRWKSKEGQIRESVSLPSFLVRCSINCLVHFLVILLQMGNEASSVPAD